jgi:hypothetical protein
MNQFLVSSAIIGSTMGVIHGYKSRHNQPHKSNKMQISLFEDVGYGVRDAAFGAVVFPFIIPIGLYQIACSKVDGCVFQSLTKKSSPSSETPLQ